LIWWQGHSKINRREVYPV